MQLLQIGVATQFLCYDSISILVLVATMFLYCKNLYRDSEVCCDIVLSALNLISYCNFILMLRHGLLELLMFAVTTQFVMS